MTSMGRVKGRGGDARSFEVTERSIFKGSTTRLGDRRVDNFFFIVIIMISIVTIAISKSTGITVTIVIIVITV